jgi:hypothetical protein
MREIVGNLWDFPKEGYWIGITTNGSVKKDGEAVMGQGTALQAAQRFPDLPKRLGHLLSNYPNRPYAFPMHKLLSIPTKQEWKQKSDLTLIVQSMRDVFEFLTLDSRLKDKDFYAPRVGCGPHTGQLDWEKEVKPALVAMDLPDNFVVVSLKGD